MRVLVDSSVWVDFLNGHPSVESDALAALIDGEDDPCTCGIVVSEVFQGLRRDKGRDRLERLFRELTLLEPSGIDIYLRAAEVFRALRRRGVTIRSTIDCVFAAIAEENGCQVLARDRDITAIIDSGIVEIGPWRVST